jgi:hypothetical protein
MSGWFQAQNRGDYRVNMKQGITKWLVGRKKTEPAKIKAGVYKLF